MQEGDVSQLNSIKGAYGHLSRTLWWQFDLNSEHCTIFHCVETIYTEKIVYNCKVPRQSPCNFK